MADGRCRICGGEYDDPEDPNRVVEGLCGCCDVAKLEGAREVAGWLRSGSWPKHMPHAFRTPGTSDVMACLAEAIDAGEHHVG